MATIPLLQGAGELPRRFAQAPDPVVLSDRGVWDVLQRLGIALPAPLWVDGLERRALQRLAATVAAFGTRELWGIGGGRVMDATKFVAEQLDRPYVLAPSSSASNAPFTRYAAVEQNGVTVGSRVRRLPTMVVVDLDVVAQAPPRLNRAGFGDALALAIVLKDWTMAAQAGAISWDDQVAGALQALVAEVLAAVPDLDAPQRVPWLFSVFQRHGALIEEHPALPLGAASEHLFAWSLNAVAGREILHGGAVALGVLLMAPLHGLDGKRLRLQLDSAGVPWHPEQDLGVSWETVAEALRQMPAYNRRHRHLRTVLDQVSWDEDLVQRLISHGRGDGEGQYA